MSLNQPNQRKFALHGPAVELDCSVPAVCTEIDRLFQPFAVQGWPDGFVPTSGTVRPYAQSEVLRHLSPTAKALPRAQDTTELYEDGERFWMIDERWGMAEINFLKGQWRSWVLAQPKLDAVRCAEMAVLWPMAQLLRARGLYLLPAISAVKDGWAVLLLSPFGMEPELAALVRGGYKIIGQRWTAVREEDGRLAMLHLPGQIERASSSRLRSRPGEARGGWIDLYDEHVGSWQNHAFCDAVLVAEPGRRPKAQVREVAQGDAISVMRRAWPLVELHPQRRYGQLALKLSQHCRCAELQLSRNPQDLPTLLDEMRVNPVSEAGATTEEAATLSPWRDSRAGASVAA